MRRFASILTTLLFVLVAQSHCVLADVTVPPSDSHIAYVGRFTDDFRFGWTGSTMRLRFDGTSAAAMLSLTSGDKAAMQVIVDGQPTQTLIITPAQSRYDLAADLPAGPHTIELFKRTEGFYGELKFGGFELSDDAKPLALPPVDRRILIIGDSITCGYGNEAATVAEGLTVENENGYMSYGPIAARAVHADILMLCWSGRGLYRTRGLKNDREGLMPSFLDKPLPMNSRITCDPDRYVPNIIVINLGTNDCWTENGKKPELTKDQYLDAYRRFIEQLHKLHPDAQIIAAIGPMLVEPVDGWLVDLEQQYPYVHRLVFEAFRGKEEIGGHTHPSVKGHQRMADELTTEIRKLTNW
ncbi:MAG: SGNH/GDSL hydrolase family protein [Phycisphaerales bacterium]